MRAAGLEAPRGAVWLLELDAPGGPAPDEVLIDVQAAGVGNWDEIMRTDGWPSGLDVPHALGVEAAGVVAAVGRDVAGFAPGDPVLTHVYPFRGGACWAEQLLAPASAVAPRPASLGASVAALLPVPALTAYQALHDVLRIGAGERLFVHGAGGVTGSLLVQLGLEAGASVVATAGRPRFDWLSRVGRAQLVGEGGSGDGPPEQAGGRRDSGEINGRLQLVDRTRYGWEGAVRRALGPGADAVVNAAPNGSKFAAGMMRVGGRLVSITDQPPEPGRYHVVRPDGAQLTVLAAMAADGKLRIPAARPFPLESAAGAMRMVEKGEPAVLLI
jgi:NADPH:quinone reductase-like Zn-dependent oxidoreductase